MERKNLNLARKWRPHTFSEIIGQDLSIRMLKNGLFLKKYFPLYIFSGQRGCGKTSTARVFSAALNCEALLEFQKNPKQSIPCVECNSCKSMLGQQHPDFIEMDAASHTGVDNVRQILESASFISISGGAKIYLIDEAHMLSRAAFNAFLKILEEPPANVFFILATTELHKIPDTVRSRAFQVFFNTIHSSSLKKHLSTMCLNENIEIDDEALNIIISESEGSARDAINLLERVRLLNTKITEDLVLETLGKISEKKLFELFTLLLKKEPTKVLMFLQAISFENLSPQSLWGMLVSLCRAMVWMKHGISDLPAPFDRSVEAIKKLSDNCSISRLNAIMQLFFTQEDLFLKTSQKHLFLETVLLQICGQVNSADLESLIQSLGDTSEAPKKSSGPTLKERVADLKDSLLTTIFDQARLGGFKDGKLSITLASNSKFLSDKVLDSLDILKPILEADYPGFQEFLFEKAPDVPKPVMKVTPRRQGPQSINISDKDKWPKSNLLATHFSGKIETVGK